MNKLKRIEKNMDQLNIDIDKDKKKTLHLIAVQNDTTMAELMRQAIDRAIEMNIYVDVNK